MYVCICRAVTENQVRQATCAGACSMRQLRDCLGVAADCGRCAAHARSVQKETLATLAPPALELQAA